MGALVRAAFVDHRRMRRTRGEEDRREVVEGMSDDTRFAKAKLSFDKACASFARIGRMPVTPRSREQFQRAMSRLHRSAERLALATPVDDPGNDDG
jgi:hypothetical protein